jgi:hypothetical protein
MTNLSLRRAFVPVLLTSLGLSVVAAGCGEDGSNPLGDLCCTDFKVGADLTGVDFGVDASIKGQFGVFAQAVSDLSATATATLNDVELSCRNIAIDLGAGDAEQTQADAKTGAARTQAWCALAAGQINAKFGANGTLGANLKVQYTPPVCEASFSAKADCQAQCTGSATCDIKATPPTCDGGKLEIECKGSCTAEANVAISCEGSCTGMCKGSCSAKPGGVAIDCDGECEGTCAAGGSANGTGIQADGTCKGTCSGTCRARAEAPSLQCQGTCNGSCMGECKAEAGASVRCDGKCNADYEPISCKGGTLKGGCTVEASCDANCEASIKAKAECRPPELAITADVKGGLDANLQTQFNIALESLRVNLPSIAVAFRARGQAFLTGLQASVTAGGSIAADPGKLGVKGAACGAAIVATAGSATANFKASLDAAGVVAGAAKL